MLEFGISEINAGECSWAVGKASSTTETVLAGRVLFSKRCFAFDCHEVDHVARWAARSQPPGEDAASICCAKDFAFKQSLEVRFEDIERVDSDGENFMLTFAGAATCFLRRSGFGKVASVSGDVTGGARSICFRVAPASEGQVSFAEAAELALAHAPHLQELFQQPPAVAEPSPTTPTRAKRPGHEPDSCVKRQRLAISAADLWAPGAVWLKA